MDSLLDLALGEIHLWLAFYDEIADAQLHRAYRALLNPAEQAQEPRFYFAKDRRRYLVTRALVRTVLSRYAPVNPEDWVFATNAYGRPEVRNQGLSDTLSFNISHTHSLIVLGVTKRSALGVDVENVAARGAAIDIADRFFAPEEVAALAATPRDQREFRFFEYWTFKEAYIKARGMGLSIPLDKFSFHFPDRYAVRLVTSPELGDDAGLWQFWQLQPTSEYLVAVCAERNGLQPSSLVVRKVVPGKSEQSSATIFSRSSRR